MRFLRESLERVGFIKLTIPLFSSRTLNVENDPSYCSKDWKSDNYKVEHKEWIFRQDCTENSAILEVCKRINLLE